MLAQRSEVLVQYWGHNNQWHARYLLSWVHDDEWVCVTPDGDIYDEDLGAGSAEIEWVRARPLGHGIPLGVVPGHVYDFNPHPTADQLTGLVAEGRREVVAECGRQGCAVPPEGVPLALGAGAGLSVLAALVLPSSPLPL